MVRVVAVIRVGQKKTFSIIHPVEILSPHYNIDFDAVLHSPCPRIWYLYERYLDLATYAAVEKSPVPSPGLVFSEKFADWDEVSRPPDWKIVSIAKRLVADGKSEIEVAEILRKEGIYSNWSNKNILNKLKELGVYGPRAK